MKYPVECQMKYPVKRLMTCRHHHHARGQEQKKTIKSMSLYCLIAKVINSENHFQAIQNEKNCALAMKDSEEDICMQYDTTQRRRIKGDWTSLIVKIKNVQTFRLRPLSLAVENRQTICDLMVEELTRLAKAGSIDAKTLWEKICALMTD